MNISNFNNSIKKDEYFQQEQKNIIQLPYPSLNEEDKKDFVFRLILKPETGVLWGFN